MPIEPIKLLLVGLANEHRARLGENLAKDLGVELDMADLEEDVFQILQRSGCPFHILLVDGTLKAEDGGIQQIKAIRKEFPDILVILLNQDRKEIRNQARDANVFRCLDRPCDWDELLPMVQAAAKSIQHNAIIDHLEDFDDPEQMIKEILVSVCELTCADEAAILLMDQENGKLEKFPVFPGSEPDIVHLFADHKFSRALLSAGTSVIIGDMLSDPRISEDFHPTQFRSLMGTPVGDGGQTIGMVYAFSRNPCFFDHFADKNPIEDIAVKLGSILETAGKLRRSRKQVDYLEQLIEVGNDLTCTTDLQEQCALVWKFVSSQLKVSTFVIGLYDGLTDKVEFPWVVDKGEKQNISPRTVGGDRQAWGCSGYVLRVGKELIWQNQAEKKAELEKAGIEPIRIGDACESCFYLPLRAGDRITGLISIQSYESCTFSEQLLNVFRAVASLLSTSLENRRLFLAEQSRGKEAESLRVAALNLSKVINSRELTRNLLSELKKVVPYDSASVQLLRDGKFAIVDCDGFANRDDLLELTFDAEGNNPNHDVYIQQRPVIFEDVVQKYPQMLRPPHDLTALHGWLGVPMIAPDGMIGMLALDKNTADFYTRDHARLALAFATQAALAIRNMELRDSTWQANQYIQSAYEASLDIISPMTSPEVLTAIIDKIRVQTGAWRVAIVLWEENEPPRVLVQVGYNDDGRKAGNIRKNGVTAAVRNSCQPRYFPDARRMRDVNPGMLDEGVQASACLPWQVKEKPLGVIWIHFREAHEFSPLEQKVLATLATQSAVAFQHSRFYEDLDSVQNATRAVAHSVAQQPPRDALDAIVRAAQNVLHCDIVTLYSYEPETGTFDFPPAMVGVKDQYSVSSLGRVSGNSLVRRIIEEDEPYICTDTSSDALVHQAYERKGQTLNFVQREGIGSFCGVPLKVGDRKVGVLFINFQEAKSREKFDQEKISLFSNQAAIAIRNSQLLKESQEKEELLRAVVAANQTITETLSLQDVLRSITEEAYKLTGKTGPLAKIAYIALRQKNQLVFQAAYPESMLGSLDHNLFEVDLNGAAEAHSVAARAIERRETILVSDAAAAEQNFLMLGSRAHSVVTVPIKWKDEVTGVISVEHDEAEIFDQRDTIVLKMLADQAASTIHNADLFERISESRRYIEALYEAGAIMLSSLAPKKMLDAIVENIARTLGAWRATVLLIEEGSETPRVISQFGFEDPAEARLPVRPDGISKRVIRTNEPSYWEDIQLKGSDIHPRVLQFGTRAAACLPFVSGTDSSKVIGVLWIHFNRPHYFSEQEKDALRLYAAHSALAYQRSLDFEELKHTQGLVGARTAVAWMGMVSSTWRHSIEKNANAILFDVSTLRIQLKSLNPDPLKVDGCLDRIKNSATTIRKKPINELSPEEKEGGAVQLNRLVQERLLQLWADPRYNNIPREDNLHLSNDVLVRANSEMLRQALDIVIDNAAKVLADIPEPRLRIETLLLEKRARIIIEDNGPGIPERLRQYILIKPVPKDEGELGLGLGLLMAQTIIQSYGGEINPDYTFAEGTRFVIDLPVESSRESV